MIEVIVMIVAALFPADVVVGVIAIVAVVVIVIVIVIVAVVVVVMSTVEQSLKDKGDREL